MNGKVIFSKTSGRLFALLLCGLLAGSRASAQVSTMTLTVNVAATAFTATYSSAYSSDLTTTQAAQMTVVSTGPFSIAVRSNTPYLYSGSNTLPLDVFKIGITNSNLGAQPFPPIPLANYSQTLITNARTSTGITLDVQYTLLTYTKFSTFASRPSGAYSTTLIYTISAP